MEDNLVGYLLNALDDGSRRDVEDYLQTHPEGRKQLGLLRQALEPLEADAEEINPPPGLAVRTLATVAEYCCRDLPRAPVPSHRWSEATPARWWRRADVLVAASLFLCASLLIPPLAGYLHRQYQLASCQNNLRQFGLALINYSQAHRGAFPHVADANNKVPPDRQVAGLFVPMLVGAGFLKPDEMNVRCPANGEPVGCPYRLEELADPKKVSDDKFSRLATQLSGCYAYTLGYREGRDLRGCCQRAYPVPIMSDRPLYREEALRHQPEANSPNHGGRGQNVLFTDGHVAFLTSRLIGPDDIFLNKHRHVAAGVDPDDTVLGVSEARPVGIGMGD
jgi:prepilin-type processing-associated H-X9-DG protein